MHDSHQEVCIKIHQGNSLKVISRLTIKSSIGKKRMMKMFNKFSFFVMLCLCFVHLNSSVYSPWKVLEFCGS